MDQGQFDMPQMDEAQIEEQRNRLWGCFFSTKHKFFAINSELQEIFSAAQEKSQDLYRKILGDMFERCVNIISAEESQKILSDLQTNAFDVESWDHLHNFRSSNYQDVANVDVTLNPQQEMLLNYYDEMDKQLREKYGDPEEQGGQENMFNQKRDIEPKIGGLSIANASPQTKLIYTAIVAAIVGGVFYFAYSLLFVKKETPVERAERLRREKKEKKRQGSNSSSRSPSKKKNQWKNWCSCSTATADLNLK